MAPCDASGSVHADEKGLGWMALAVVVVCVLMIGRNIIKKRNRSAMATASAEARDFFYLCDEGTEESIHNETGYSSLVVGMVYGLMKEYCSAHSIALPPVEIYYFALKQNHRYHKKRDAKLLSCYYAYPGPKLCTSTKMVKEVRPCMKLLAEVLISYRPRIINWEDRCTGISFDLLR